jgi:hypothetical protein
MCVHEYVYIYSPHSYLSKVKPKEAEREIKVAFEDAMIIFIRTGAVSGHENIKNVIVSILFGTATQIARNLGNQIWVKCNDLWA